jgi:predicted nucleotidyltransferase
LLYTKFFSEIVHKPFPEEKQQELLSITDALVQLVHPEMIILFGSYSRGDWVEDTYKENGTTVEYRSDYDSNRKAAGYAVLPSW